MTETENKNANGGAESQKKSCSTKIKEYFKSLPKRYFITAFSGMAQGLFVTLIAGTILAMLAGWIGDNYVGKTLSSIASIAKTLMGAGIGVGIARALEKSKLCCLAAAVAGMVGAFADKLMPGSSALALTLGIPGNPIGSYVVTMLCVELVGLYEGKTGLDIILVPIGTLIISLGGVFVAYPFIYVIDKLGVLIALATDATPFVMGMIISAIMGVLLTMPTSSAAIWVAVSTPVLTGYALGSPEYAAMLLAGGAATCGCAAHMIGYAVMSYRENKIGGLIAQGLGTSMLQIPNIMRHPQSLIPPIIASLITGPLSTCVFMLKCGSSGGGMGTSGLVGVFGLIDNIGDGGALYIAGIALCMFVIPAIVCFFCSEFMRKKGWLTPECLKLEL